jgi:hypothetical protein
VDVALFHTTSQGRVVVFRGANDGYSPTRVMDIVNDSATPTNDRFGRSIAQGMVPGLEPWGDFNGDGYSDVFVGSNQNATVPGAAQLFLGHPNLPATRNRSTADVTLDPETTGGGFRSAGLVGDLDGDGSPDLAVGDHAHLSNTGQVVIYY